jgi:Protein of unknown function (DUF3168)
MADHSVDLFTAIYATLAADVPLQALLGTGERIWDHVKPGAKPPYVVLGEETATDYASTLVDAQEHTITIHAWSEKPSTLEVKRIMAAVRDALHERKLVMWSGTCVQMRMEFKEAFRDPDGISHHGVMRFRAVTTSN